MKKLLFLLSFLIVNNSRCFLGLGQKEDFSHEEKLWNQLNNAFKQYDESGNLPTFYKKWLNIKKDLKHKVGKEVFIDNLKELIEHKKKKLNIEDEIEEIKKDARSENAVDAKITNAFERIGSKLDKQFDKRERLIKELIILKLFKDELLTKKEIIKDLNDNGKINDELRDYINDFINKWKKIRPGCCNQKEDYEKCKKSDDCRGSCDDRFLIGNNRCRNENKYCKIGQCSFTWQEL